MKADLQDFDYPPLPDVPEPLAPTPAPARRARLLPFEEWESLAYDLAIAALPVQDVIEGYGITREDYERLLGNMTFASLLAAKREEVSRMGADAAFKVKMKLIVGKTSAEYLRRMFDPDTDAKAFHTMFKTAAELAELIPDPRAAAAANSVQQAAAVTFNINGIPGLAHLQGQPAASPAVVQAAVSAAASVTSSAPAAFDDDDLEAL